MDIREWKVSAKWKRIINTYYRMYFVFRLQEVPNVPNPPAKEVPITTTR